MDFEGACRACGQGMAGSMPMCLGSQQHACQGTGAPHRAPNGKSWGRDPDLGCSSGGHFDLAPRMARGTGLYHRPSMLRLRLLPCPWLDTGAQGGGGRCAGAAKAARPQR